MGRKNTKKEKERENVQMLAEMGKFRKASTKPSGARETKKSLRVMNG